jgi:hypothetical protein
LDLEYRKICEICKALERSNNLKAKVLVLIILFASNIFLNLVFPLNSLAIDLKSDHENTVTDTTLSNWQGSSGLINQGVIFFKPGPIDYIKNAPFDFVKHAQSYIQKRNVPTLGAVLVSTLSLTSVDQRLVASAVSLGNDLGISHNGHARNISPIHELPVRVPTDLGSSMYFIGDGLTQFVINASFWTYGWLAKDNRALQTASQISEGLLVVGAYVQVLKHITGRESPGKATAPGGVWRVFPNQIKTVHNVTKYDAFPSGHIANAMMTVTVIANNYPEYKFIRPLGYGLMTVLSYQMLNNGVHWASDYPLALFIGHDIAKIIIKNGRTVNCRETNSGKHDWKNSVAFTPIVVGKQGVGIQIKYVF